MRYRRLALILACILLIWAMGVATPGGTFAAAGPGASAPAGSATVGAGDTLHLFVHDLIHPGEDHEADVQVNENGDIRVQNLGMVHVAGLTPAEVEQKIGQVGVEGHFLSPKSRVNPGPQVSIKLLTKAAGNGAARSTIGLGDRLSIRVPELVTPGVDYIGEARVNELGDVKLMNLGRIHVADMTSTQVEEKIVQLAIERHFLLPKGETSPGPAAFVRVLERANAPILGGVLPKIAPVDTLRIEIHELVTPGLTYSVDRQVNDQGDIRILNLGIVRVAGLTTDEIEDKIGRQAVAAGFLMAKSDTNPGPQVIVTHMKKAAPGEKPAAFRPGDTLEIHASYAITQGKPFPTTLLVSPAGDISLARLGTLHAADLTSFQLEDAIIKKNLSVGNIPPGAPDRPDGQISVSLFGRNPATSTAPAGLP